MKEIHVTSCVGVKSLIDLPLTAQVIGFMPNNGGHWHFVTFRITHFCYLLDRINPPGGQAGFLGLFVCISDLVI